MISNSIEKSSVLNSLTKFYLQNQNTKKAIELFDTIEHSCRNQELAFNLIIDLLNLDDLLTALKLAQHMTRGYLKDYALVHISQFLINSNREINAVKIALKIEDYRIKRKLIENISDNLYYNKDRKKLFDLLKIIPCSIKIDILYQYMKITNNITAFVRHAHNEYDKNDDIKIILSKKFLENPTKENLEKAFKIALHIESEKQEDKMMFEIIKKWIEKDDYEKATKIVHYIHSEENRSGAMKFISSRENKK